MKRLWAIYLLLLLSIQGYVTIPFWSYWGLDLQNLWQFHHCELARNSPYLVPGASCGDPLSRDMIYPPLLYWLFAWLRLVSFQQARWIWAAFTIGLSTAAACAWVPKPERGWNFWLFWLLLLAQVPMLFALERGNNDAVTLASWSLAFLVAQNGGWARAGALASISSLLKIYPAIPSALIGIGLLRRRSTAFFRYVSAAMIAAGLGIILLLPQSETYFFKILPAWAQTTQPAQVTSHALESVLHSPFQIAVIQLALVGIWATAAWKHAEARPEWIFAGTFAISTYFSNVSNDYNLLSAYPLLLILFRESLLRKTPTGTAKPFLLLFFGLFSIVGNRYLFCNPWFDSPKLHTFLQVAWLAWVGVWLSRSVRQEQTKRGATL